MERERTHGKRVEPAERVKAGEAIHGQRAPERRHGKGLERDRLGELLTVATGRGYVATMTNACNVVLVKK
jgi:hypothetical protein